VTRFEDDKTPVNMYDMAFAKTKDPFVLVKIIVELDVLLNCVLKLSVPGRFVLLSFGVNMIPFWGSEYVGESRGVMPISWRDTNEFERTVVTGPLVDDKVM